MTKSNIPSSASAQWLEQRVRELERQLAEVSESEKRFRSLTNSSQKLMMMGNPAGVAIFFNEFFYHYTGLREEDAMNGNWAQAVHPDDIDEFMATRNVSIPAQKPYEFRARFRRHDGAYRWHLGRTVPVMEEGKIQNWVGTASDIHELVETERALRESEARFKLMTESIPQLVWISLNNGKVEFYSPRWYAYTGLTPAESEAGWDKIIHPDDLMETLAAWKKSTEMGVPFSVEQRLRSSDGSYRWFLAKAQPLVDETGAIVRWYGTCTDIEDQKRLQAEARITSERLEVALEGGRMGAWELDLHNDRLTWTPSVSLLYGLDLSLTSGPMNALEPYVHPDDLPGGQETIKAAIRDVKPFRMEYRIIRPDKSIRWLEARGRVYAETPDAPLRLAGIMADITDRKEVEKELARRADDLVRSNKELEQFAFVASHDLKEPLRKISGYAELIQSRYHDKLDEKGERFLSYLQDGVKRMDAIIGDLLTYSRAGRGGEVREAVDMADIVKDVLEDLEKALEDVHAKVTVNGLPPVYVNRTQIRQVIQNLVANAIKFHGEAAPEIVISAEKAKEYWRFSVKDNGIGMEQQYFERIFEIFQRLHTRTEYPGTGIGLAICKKIVEQHGGKIWAESTVGAGSTFFFTLPAF